MSKTQSILLDLIFAVCITVKSDLCINTETAQYFLSGSYMTTGVSYHGVEVLENNNPCKTQYLWYHNNLGLFIGGNAGPVNGTISFGARCHNKTVTDATECVDWTPTALNGNVHDGACAQLCGTPGNYDESLITITDGIIPSICAGDFIELDDYMDVYKKTSSNHFWYKKNVDTWSCINQLPRCDGVPFIVYSQVSEEQMQESISCGGCVPTSICLQNTIGNTQTSSIYECDPWGNKYLHTFNNLDCFGISNMIQIDISDDIYDYIWCPPETCENYVRYKLYKPFDSSCSDKNDVGYEEIISPTYPTCIHDDPTTNFCIEDCTVDHITFTNGATFQNKQCEEYPVGFNQHYWYIDITQCGTQTQQPTTTTSEPTTTTTLEAETTTTTFEPTTTFEFTTTSETTTPESTIITTSVTTTSEMTKSSTTTSETTASETTTSATTTAASTTPTTTSETTTSETTTSETTISTTNPIYTECFIGSKCKNINDCCPNDIDENLFGIRCKSIKKKKNKKSKEANKKICCIDKGFSCTMHNQCCSNKKGKERICLNGICQNNSKYKRASSGSKNKGSSSESNDNALVSDKQIESPKPTSEQAINTNTLYVVIGILVVFILLIFVLFCVWIKSLVKKPSKATIKAGHHEEELELVTQTVK